MGEDYISWNDGNAATYMWLALLFGRTIMLLGTHACLWNMVYEMYCEPTARFSRNPYYVYDVEKALIRHLLNYVMLMGMSIWFVNETQFNLLSSLAQTVLLSLAALALVLTACYTLNVLRYLACKERLEFIDQLPENRFEAVWTRLDQSRMPCEVSQQRDPFKAVQQALHQNREENGQVHRGVGRAS